MRRSTFNTDGRYPVKAVLSIKKSSKFKERLFNFYPFLSSQTLSAKTIAFALDSQLRDPVFLIYGLMSNLFMFEAQIGVGVGG
jgi:hypothetical protein